MLEGERGWRAIFKAPLLQARPWVLYKQPSRLSLSQAHPSKCSLRFSPMRTLPVATSFLSALETLVGLFSCRGEMGLFPDDIPKRQAHNSPTPPPRGWCVSAAWQALGSDNQNHGLMTTPPPPL